jgi:hypothetical protein
MRILCVVGMFLGAGMIGLAVNNKVGQAWAVLTG